MSREEFDQKLRKLFDDHEKLITRNNEKIEKGNGIFHRYKYPVITAEHTPVFWRYDLDYNTNPYLLERLGVNGTFNAGAIEFNGKVLLGVRVEGNDRKSFLAIAESPNGIDNFKFWDYPITMPETENPDTNVYDIRFVKPLDELLLHEVFKNFDKVITVEDGCIMGGMGSAVIEFMTDNNYSAQVKRLGIPDKVIEHGEQKELYAECGFDDKAIVTAVRDFLKDKKNTMTA